MRFLLPLIILLITAGFCAAVTVDEVIRLTSLKTSEEVILDLIRKTGVQKPLTTADVLRMKERGVSDRVIKELLRTSDELAKKRSAAAKSAKLPENLRAYYTTTADGKEVRVVTNIDENGKRMGPPAPKSPEPPPAAQPYQTEPPREIRVIVEQPIPERPMEDDYDSDPYDRYGPPQPSGIPLYGYDGYYPSVYPGYPDYPFPDRPCKRCGHQGKGGLSNKAYWREDAGYGRHKIRPSRPAHVDSSRPHFQGSRRSPK